MTNYKFKGKLGELIERAELGNAEDVDFIINHLNDNPSLALTRYIDYALGLVENQNGISRMEYYLFQGTLIQRNYSSLFFNRRYDFDLVLQAFEAGLIDETQAFAR